MDKREFLKSTLLSGIALSFGIEQLLAARSNRSAENIASDEDFWLRLRSQYYLKPDYINLENGYYNMMPKPILDEFLKQVTYLNTEASYYKRTKMAEDKIYVRRQLAELVGCETEELIITRNTTESIDTVINGFDWKAGDEVIMASQDYGAMLDMFKQQAQRYGIINKIISIPNHPKSDDELIDLYERTITSNTRLILVSHMINITGQIMPVKKLCDMAHQKGVKVLVDGAHAVGQFDFKIGELHCDYYASSLHKWLSVPLGAGILYVQKNNIESLWPLFGEQNYSKTDIRKLNHTGTHPMHTELTVPYAIKFYHELGASRKEERLRYLKNYWTEKVINENQLVYNTPLAQERSCAIANVGLKHMNPSVMASELLKKYHIWTVAIDHEHVKGCRITPNIYTTTHELDQLVLALREMSAQ